MSSQDDVNAEFEKQQRSQQESNKRYNKLVSTYRNNSKKGDGEEKEDPDEGKKTGTMPKIGTNSGCLDVVEIVPLRTHFFLCFPHLSSRTHDTHTHTHIIYIHSPLPSHSSNAVPLAFGKASTSGRGGVKKHLTENGMDVDCKESNNWQDVDMATGVSDDEDDTGNIQVFM